MKSFFLELLQQNNHFNNKIISFLTGNQNNASEKCIRLISHILNVHQIWNSKILTDQSLYEPWKIHQIQDLNEFNKSNFEKSTSILNGFKLDQTVEYTTSAGQMYRSYVRDILFQIVNHSTYHRGQIATEFRESGLEPLLTDYICYKMIDEKKIDK